MKTMTEITCPHQDGDYILKVLDMHNWATGYCMLTQTGQGEEHNIILSTKEVKQLLPILKLFVLDQEEKYD